MSTTTAPLTVEEFLALPESSDQRRELIGGELVAMSFGKRRHEMVKSNVCQLLVAWLLQNHAGRVFFETGFRFDDQTFVIPDVSFFAKDPGQPGEQRHFHESPDLAIEVVSSESASDLSRKVSLYLANGSKSVWVVYPEQQQVWIYTAGHATEFQRDQMLEDPVLPGFRAPVSALFEGI
jgi:Uma2 family endonuclease